MGISTPCRRKPASHNIAPPSVASTVTLPVGSVAGNDINLSREETSKWEAGGKQVGSVETHDWRAMFLSAGTTVLRGGSCRLVLQGRTREVSE
jgi:hypothetical protein